MCSNKDSEMNERIRELAVEAGIISAEYNGFDPTGLTKAQRKFAELIVQDCIDICDAYGMPDGTSQTAMILSAAIKRKFGIIDVDTQLRNRSTYFGNDY
jgi:hypothetical protein